MAKYDFNNTPAPYAEGFADGQKDMLEKACQWWIDYVSYPQDTEEDKARNKEMIDEFRKAMTL